MAAGRFGPRFRPDIIEDFSTPTSPPLTSHPVVKLLYHEPVVVRKARAWAWRQAVPTGEVNDGTNYPSKYPTRLIAVAAFWHWALMREYRENANRPVFADMMEFFEYSLSLAEAYPDA